MALSKLFSIALAVELATDVMSPFPIFSFVFEVLIFSKLGFKSLFILNSFTYLLFLIKYNAIVNVGMSFLPPMSFEYSVFFMIITFFSLVMGFIFAIFGMILFEFIVHHLLRFIFPKVFKRIEGNIY